jgi:hypothetical protein
MLSRDGFENLWVKLQHVGFSRAVVNELGNVEVPSMMVAPSCPHAKAFA